MSSYECDIHVNFDVGVLNWLTTWFCEAFKSIIPGVICNVSKFLWFCTTWTIIGVVLWNLLCFLKRWYFPSSTSAKKKCVWFVLICSWDSVEGDGDVLQDFGGGEAGHPEGAVLHAPLWIAHLLHLPAACQPDCSRSTHFWILTPFFFCRLL